MLSNGREVVDLVFSLFVIANVMVDNKVVVVVVVVIVVVVVVFPGEREW